MENNWKNWVKDAIWQGSMLEQLVNCFLEALEGKTITDIQMLNSCSGLTKKCKQLDEQGLGCILAWKYAGIARPLLPEGV